MCAGAAGSYRRAADGAAGVSQRIGADEVQPFSMSLEAEMMLEHLKEQHLQEIEELQSQLECKV
ncbi:hypothetical protein F7725_008413 [Dissostichus mawsoni]|uniref:Uncharacterized protein n=1 Tax=Dissostichus mawsoni TaxID=36200 RepID=A0A7J5Y7A5_DISMA|nr:hypothetical protein F7725_008413 [Dissostichus mawsoni]